MAFLIRKKEKKKVNMKRIALLMRKIKKKIENEENKGDSLWGEDNGVLEKIREIEMKNGKSIYTG